MIDVAVIAAGNGGTGIAAWMSLKGCNVSLYDKDEGVLKEISDAGGIHLKGTELSGFAPIRKVTSHIAEALEGRRLIMVAPPAFAHKDIARVCAPFLGDGQTVILNPGRTAGAIEFRKTARDVNPDASFTVGETQSLIFACRKTGYAETTIYSVKRRMKVAALPASRTPDLLGIAAPYFPQFEAAENVLETSLGNIGSVFHPAPAILNIARIEEKESFEHYRQGISPSVARVLERINDERMAVARAMNVRTQGAREWLHEVYGMDVAESESLYEAIHKQEAYRGIKAPADVFTRYISEDVPMGLVPLSELGRAFGVGAPTMDAIILLADIIHGKDYRATGRNLKSLGLEGMSATQIRDFVGGE